MKHFVNGRNLFDSYPDNSEEIILGAGCFWGVERIFWQTDGVWVTYASYCGGHRPEPNYEQVCTGVSGHAETVNVIFDKQKISTDEILKIFWECHDPTQGMRQGNDIGSQYRSIILSNNSKEIEPLQDSKKKFQIELDKLSYGSIKTEIVILDKFYLAEDYHQKYLHKNPNGYCGLKGTGAHYT